MQAYASLFVQAAFVENLALAFFLGMCTFLATSKRVETAIGVGIAVIVVPTLAPMMTPMEAVKENGLSGLS